ncbi:MAG TPA: hypothetical protein VGJ94_06055 [Syntrophorhabdaceae bacterium]|jgi:hypothetical protein
MGDLLPKSKAAAIQAAPVFLGRDGSVEIPSDSISRPGAHGPRRIHSGRDR